MGEAAEAAEVWQGDTRDGTVARLRERIRQLEAAPRRYLATLRTGLAALDGLLPAGGFPLGQAVELWGEAASGRTSLALRALAAAHREGRLGAWVDGPGELYPPAAAALGVDLTRLLIVRPPARERLVWSALQLLRSGAFACVVLDLTHTGVRLSLAEAKKLTDAAGKGGSALLLLTPRDAPGEGALRLHAEARGPEGLELSVVRSRQGGHGARARLPWSALYPGLAAPACAPRVLAPPAVHRPAAPFERERKSARRNGHAGILGQRPGRDASQPRLHAGLGVAGHA